MVNKKKRFNKPLKKKYASVLCHLIILSKAGRKSYGNALKADHTLPRLAWELQHAVGAFGPRSVFLDSTLAAVTVLCHVKADVTKNSVTRILQLLVLF